MKASLKLELLAVQSEHQVNAMLEITAPAGPRPGSTWPAGTGLT